MPEKLTFKRYPPFLSLGQVTPVLGPDSLVIVHEKVIGQAFRILYNQGTITFGTATRRITEKNKRYKDCIDILISVGLDRFDMIRMPRFMVYGYFIGIGPNSSKYPSKKFIITDIFNAHGKLLSYNNMAQLAGILGHPVIPLMYRGAFDIRAIRAACRGSKLTVDRSDIGYIMKTDPPAELTFADDSKEWCIVDLSRDISGGLIMEAPDIIKDLIFTLKEMPFTLSTVEEINGKMGAELSYKKWLAEATSAFLDIFTDRYERILYNYMDRLVETKLYESMTGEEIRNAVLAEISKNFDTIAGYAYEGHYKKIHQKKETKKHARRSSDAGKSAKTKPKRSNKSGKKKQHDKKRRSIPTQLKAKK